MDYLSEFENIKKIFMVLGFENSRYRIVILRFNLILLALHIVILASYRTDVVYTLDSLSESCDTLKVFVTLSSWICEIYLIWKYPVLRADVWDYFNEMDMLMETFYVKAMSSKCKLCSKYVWKFYIITGIYISRIITEIIVIREETQALFFTTFTLYSLMYCLFKQVHVIYYIDMLNYYFEVLNEQVEYLSELLQCNEKLKSEKYENFLIKRLQITHQYYQILRDSRKLINKWFEPFLFVYQLKIVGYISASLYWMIYRLNNQKDLISNYIILVGTFEIIAHLIQLISLTDSCEKLFNQKVFLSYRIHNIRINKRNCCNQLLLMDYIESFSIDLMNDNFEFSASGYFNIGYRWMAEVSQYKRCICII